MVKCLTILLFFTTFLPTLGRAENILDLIQLGSEIYTRIEEENKEYIASQEWLESDYRRELIYQQQIKPRVEKQLHNNLRQYYQTCAGCPEIIPLAEAINDIVQVLAEKEDENYPELHLLEEIGELKVILGIVKHTSKPLEGGGCYTEAFCSNSDSRESIIDNSTILLFSSPIDLDKLQGIQLRHNGHNEFYYRATLDGYQDQIIIHLVVNKDGSSYMEYFSKNKHIPLSIPPKKESGDSFRMGRPDNVVGPWFGFNNEINDSGYLRGHLALGIKVPSGGGFPEKFHLLDLQVKHGANLERFLIDSDGSSLTYQHNDANIKTGIHTDYNNFSLSFEIPKYVRAAVSTDMSFNQFSAELALPTNIQKESFNLVGETKILHTFGIPQIDLETNYVLDLTAATPLSFGVETSTSFQLNNTHINSIDFSGQLDLDQDSSLSLIFELEDEENPTLTLRYNLSK